MADNLTIDAIGLLCPLPVLRLRKRLGAVAVGETVVLLADDPAAIIDVPHFCTEAGHHYEGDTVADNGARAFRITKG